jgi:2-dehydro-3-deoxyphosphooctonate aldolase (KDO 8-P synthase)
MKRFFLVENVELNDQAPFIIAGPCVIEEEGLTLEIAQEIRRLTSNLGLPFIFKASFDKANRSALDSFRGPGLQEGLRILAKIKADLGIPVLSDIHEAWQAEPAAKVLSIMQIPALLCRQTDLLQAAGKTGLPVNLKKGQFMAPEDMALAAHKVAETGNQRIILTERGFSFGYHNLVVDFRAIPIMQKTGYPVVIDAAHSVQRPVAASSTSSGDPEFIHLIACAGMAAGANGLFLEVHPRPAEALSDKKNSLPLQDLGKLLMKVKKLYNVTYECN